MGYVYQILMGRLLSPIEFGLLSALFALYSILIAPLGTLLMLISRKVAEYGAVGKEHQVLDLYADMLRRCTYTAAAFVLLWLIVSPVTQVYLQTDKAQHVYLLGLLIVVTMPMVVTMGIAQGLQKFITFGLSQLLLILVKILLAIALVLIGLAVSGVVIGSIISALLVFVFLHRVLRLRFARSERAHLSLRSSVPVFVANSALTGMTYVDILLVNYYFDPREVGVYAVAAVLGKAIIHLPAGIVQALLPIASESYARNEKGNALLWQGLGLTLVLTLGGALFYLLFGEWFVSLLFGHEYINAGVILSFYGFMVLPLAIIMVVEYYLIARQRILFAYLFGLALPCQIIATYFFHDTVYNVMWVMATGGVVVTAIGLLVIFIQHRRGKL